MENQWFAAARCVSLDLTDQHDVIANINRAHVSTLEVGDHTGKYRKIRDAIVEIDFGELVR